MLKKSSSVDIYIPTETFETRWIKNDKTLEGLKKNLSVVQQTKNVSKL